MFFQNFSFSLCELFALCAAVVLLIWLWRSHKKYSEMDFLFQLIRDYNVNKLRLLGASCEFTWGVCLLSHNLLCFLVYVTAINYEDCKILIILKLCISLKFYVKVKCQNFQIIPHHKHIVEDFLLQIHQNLRSVHKKLPKNCFKLFANEILIHANFLIRLLWALIYQILVSPTSQAQRLEKK